MAYCTSPATLRLELLDGSGNVTNTLDLMDEHNAYRVASLDIGFPVVRAVTAAMPTRDGDYDTTSLLGPSVVTITGSLIDPPGPTTRQNARADLAWWLQPRIRPRLVYAVDAGMEPMAIGLRGSQFSALYDNPVISAFSASWVAPNPVSYSLDVDTVTVYPESTSAAGGRAYPLTFPRTYPAAPAGGSGQGTIQNDGDYPTWPTFLIYGPCTNPAIWWVTPPGPAIVFTGLTVNAGDYLAVDTAAQTVLVNGLTSASRYANLDFTQTNWAPCYAGATVVRFAPATFSAPCQLVAQWNDASL